MKTVSPQYYLDSSRGASTFVEWLKQRCSGERTMGAQRVYCVHAHDLTVEALINFIVNHCASSIPSDLAVLCGESVTYITYNGYPSMCGGRILSWRAHEGTHSLFAREYYSLCPLIKSEEPPQEKLLSDVRAGIFTGSFPQTSYTGSALNQRILRVVGEFFDWLGESDHITVATSHQYTAAEEYWANRGTVHGRVWIAHYRDETSRLEHVDPDGTPPEMRCYSCDSVTSDSGWCPECEDYVLDPDEYYPLEPCVDDEDIETRSDWVRRDLENIDQPGEPTDYALHDNTRVLYGWNTSMLGYTHPLAKQAVFNEDFGQQVLNILRWGACVYRHIVLLSSNVGYPEYGLTTQTMAWLISNADRLLSEFGLKVVVPEDMATNPNERHHFIDSLAIVHVGDPSRSAPELNDTLYRAKEEEGGTQVEAA